MSTRIKCRKITYQYIVEQGEKISSVTSIVQNDANNISISLDELTRLKEGLVDSSLALVQALKILLSGVTTEAEIDRYLVKPVQ